MAREDDDEIIEVGADLIRSTEKAWLVRSDVGEEIWIPKSLAEYNERRSELSLPRWLAMQRGLI